MSERKGLRGFGETAWAKCITWLFRLAVGVTFVVSGLSKAIDPWGTLYKFEEYLAAMGIPMLHTLVLTGVFAMCALEFVLGVFLLLGCYRKSAPIVTLLFMLVMLPLTLWIAVSNPVSDCGCFGEFLILSNWATFWKNVALTIMAVWLVLFNRYTYAVVSPAFQWIAVVISLAFAGVVELTGYTQQPLVDFRPYPAGSRLFESEGDDDGEHFVFVYARNGERAEFGENDELPSEEDGWEFVERKVLAEPGKQKAEEKTFRVWDRSGDTDLSEELEDAEGATLLVLMPDMGKVSPATTWKINALHDWAARHGAAMAAVVAGTSEQIAAWEDLALPDYEIYTADDTAIKEVARGNPAVVKLEEGIIKWKSTLAAVNVEELESGEANALPRTVTAPGETFRYLVWLYLACLCVPVAMSMMPRIKDAYSSHKSRRKTHRQKEEES